MATSSITHNFVVSKPESIKLFLDAVEASEHDQMPKKTLLGKHLTDSKEIASLLKKRELQNGR